MNWLLDSHIHLSDTAYAKDMSIIINSMEKMKIKCCCVSMDYQSSKRTLEISSISNLIHPFIGIHPEMACEDSQKVIQLIESNHQKIIGIGEIGLDKTFCNNDDDFKKQKEVFRIQLDLAEKYAKPISVHSRKTLDEVLETLTSYSIDGVLIHWFDGNKKQLKKIMARNYFVSYGPVMVYSIDKQVLLSKTDTNRILIETDGPVKFSRCFGLKSAQISFISSVAFCASKILRYSYDEFTNILEENSKNYLGI